MTTAHEDAAFLALLHHVVFRMTPEQAAALMADDGPSAAAYWERKGRVVPLRCSRSMCRNTAAGGAELSGAALRGEGGVAAPAQAVR
jgi:hypothetical protein